MERLSSCYFCGAALDASLSEYPVVPKEIRPEAADRDTVVLCPTCRRKLANVVERVVDAVDGDVAEPTPSATGSGSDAGGFEWEDEDGGENADGAATDPDRTIDAERGADAAAESDDDASQTTATASDSGTESATEATAAADAAGDSGADASETAESDADQTTETSESDEQADAAGDDGDDPQMTALEYNKVMRLLQNRDLPVEKAEIRTVAINAYQISDEEFEAVIDAATSRGLIAEENGQFVSAE